MNKEVSFQILREFGNSSERKLIFSLWLAVITTVSSPFWSFIGGNLIYIILFLIVILILIPQPIVVFWARNRKGSVQEISCVLHNSAHWPLPEGAAVLDGVNPVYLAITLQFSRLFKTVTIIFEYPAAISVILADAIHGIETKTGSGVYKVKIKNVSSAKLGLLLVVEVLENTAPSQFSLNVSYKIGRGQKTDLCSLPIGVNIQI